MTADGWRPLIGDPTILGWVTVACYFAAVWLCCRAWRAERQARNSLWRPGFWLSLAVLMMLLGVNKQLDLQSYVTVIGRRIARAQGWYRRRHELQGAFVAGVALMAMVLFSGMFWWVRTGLRRYWLAAVGVAYLMAFIVIRACSFHRIDRTLGMSFGSLRMHVLEIGGIACIGACAWMAGGAGACSAGRRTGQGAPAD